LIASQKDIQPGFDRDPHIMGITWNQESVERIVAALLAAHPNFKVCRPRLQFSILPNSLPVAAIIM
jgi:hypothetical protein